MKIDITYLKVINNSSPPPLGTRVLILSGGAGAFNANDKIGYVCRKPIEAILKNLNYYAGNTPSEAEVFVLVVEETKNVVWGLCEGFKLKRLD